MADQPDGPPADAVQHHVAQVADQTGVHSDEQAVAVGQLKVARDAPCPAAALQPSATLAAVDSDICDIVVDL